MLVGVGRWAGVGTLGREEEEGHRNSCVSLNLVRALARERVSFLVFLFIHLNILISTMLNLHNITY